jgi:hypothetical protein
MTYHRACKKSNTTRRLQLGNKELPTRPEHLCSSHFAKSLVSSVLFCGSLLVFVVHFLLAIVFSILQNDLRFEPSDYPFGVFKLVF